MRRVAEAFDGTEASRPRTFPTSYALKSYPRRAFAEGVVEMSLSPSSWCRRSVAAIVVMLCCGFAAPAARAVELEARVPLVDGKVETKALTRALCDELRLPASVSLDVGRIDVRGETGSLFVVALNEALGSGCRVSVDDDALVLRVDPAKLPHDCEALKRATRTFATLAAPEAAAAQAGRYGLKFPRPLDPSRRLVVMIHGLDGNWMPIADLLQSDGFQVAYFQYPDDQPIADSAALFTRYMTALRAAYPRMPADVVAHSMGGLVARAYIEGDDYAGGIDHFLMLGTPNRGTEWAKCRVALEFQEHYHQWRSDPDWRWTWAITDGLGEAGTDLKPRSEFLMTINSRPRREGVRYTIVAGSQHPASRITSNVLEKSSNVIRGRAARWWGFRQTKAALERGAERMANKTGASDGPVKVSRTKLKGVDDFVVLPVDHASIFCAVDGNPPAAYAIVRDRLGK
jgi:pimeloyl-ACP methyl ester carboxylesterase